MSRRITHLILAAFAFAGCASQRQTPAVEVGSRGGGPYVTLAGAPRADVPRADPPRAISSEELKRDLYVFASDSFRGRETGTADAKRAAAFLARRVQLLGLEPAGDSMYMQRVPLMRETFASDTRLIVTDQGRSTALSLGADVAPVTSFGEELPEPRRDAHGEIVFVGYGNTSAGSSDGPITDDLEGKVVVMIHGAPRGTKPELKRQLESQQALGERLGQLLPYRPAAIVLLMSGGAEEFYRQILPELMRGVVPVAERSTPPDSQRTFPMVLFGIARPHSPLLPSGWPNDARPQSLGRELNAHVELRREPFTAYNVVAVVRGRDPQLNKTYLAYGAHYDHLGVMHPDASRTATATDSIANGADDDGSGSVALLAIARRMTMVRPKRSVLFVWHVAEEKGLLGSAYFTAHSTVPIDSVVAQFNADMIGRNESDMLHLVGPRAAPNYQSWRLGMIVDSVNRAYDKPLRINRQLDDPDHPEQIYRRSDHYNYAKRGIPIIFFTTGLHEDYHKVSDEASKIDYGKMARISQLMLDAGLAVANRESRPIAQGLARAVAP
jgi:hypothetical protein